VVATNDGKCTWIETTPTVGGLTGVRKQSNNKAGCSGSGDDVETYSYDARGDVVQVVNKVGGRTSTIDYSYTTDGFAQRLESWATTVVDGSTRRQQIEAYTYTANGDVRTETRNAGGRSTNALDSRGNRLSVQGGSYHGHTKRYDAAGRAREFHRNDERDRLFVGALVVSRYVFFVHDPRGNQVLSVRGMVEENESYNEHHVIWRDQATVVAAAGDTQVMRYQDSKYGKWCSFFLFGCISQGGADERVDRVRDESFSLADGLKQESWSIVVPFADPVGEPISLAAPGVSISDRLGVLPSDVVSPVEGAPGFGPGEVVAPEGEGAVVPEEEPAGEESSGVGTFSVTSPLPGIGTLGVYGEAGPDEGAAAGEAGALAGPDSLPLVEGEAALGRLLELPSPGSVLPESVTGVSAADVVAPAAAAPRAPGGGDAGGVPPPVTRVPPEVGPGPSDGPAGVIPPANSGVGSPRLPPVVPGTPGPVGGVLPPIGWVPEGAAGDGESFACLQEASVIPFCGSGGRTEPPRPAKSVSSQSTTDQTASAVATGGDQDEDARREAASRHVVRSVQTYVAQKWGDEVAEGNGAALQVIVNVTGGMHPGERARVFVVLARTIEDGSLSKEHLIQLGLGIGRQRDAHGANVAQRSLARLADRLDVMYGDDRPTTRQTAEILDGWPGGRIPVSEDAGTLAAAIGITLVIADAQKEMAIGGLLSSGAARAATAVKMWGGSALIGIGVVADAVDSISQYDTFPEQVRAAGRSVIRTGTTATAAYGAAQAAAAVCSPFGPVGVGICAGTTAIAVGFGLPSVLKTWILPE
jgi:hypothetical protein